MFTCCSLRALGIKNPFDNARIELVTGSLDPFGILQIRLPVLILPAHYDAHLSDWYAVDLSLVNLWGSCIPVHINEGIWLFLQQFHRGSPGPHISLTVMGDMAVI